MVYSAVAIGFGSGAAAVEDGLGRSVHVVERPDGGCTADGSGDKRRVDRVLRVQDIRVDGDTGIISVS